jgi:hypothetical protein
MILFPGFCFKEIFKKVSQQFVVFGFSHRCHELPHHAPNVFMAQLKFSSRMSFLRRVQTAECRPPVPARKAMFILSLAGRLDDVEFGHGAEGLSGLLVQDHELQEPGFKRLRQLPLAAGSPHCAPSSLR